MAYICKFTLAPFQELSIFTAMVSDVFGGVDSAGVVGLKEPFLQDVLSASLPTTQTASMKLLSPPKLPFISDLLEQQASKLCLVPSCRWMAKVEQLFVQTQLKHGNSPHPSPFSLPLLSLD